ncbi:hypothetical protein ACFL21_02060 [Patescibacteria group bacterium]
MKKLFNSIINWIKDSRFLFLETPEGDTPEQVDEGTDADVEKIVDKSKGQRKEQSGDVDLLDAPNSKDLALLGVEKRDAETKDLPLMGMERKSNQKDEVEVAMVDTSSPMDSRRIEAKLPEVEIRKKDLKKAKGIVKTQDDSLEEFMDSSEELQKLFKDWDDWSTDFLMRTIDRDNFLEKYNLETKSIKNYTSVAIDETSFGEDVDEETRNALIEEFNQLQKDYKTAGKEELEARLKLEKNSEELIKDSKKYGDKYIESHDEFEKYTKNFPKNNPNFNNIQNLHDLNESTYELEKDKYDIYVIPQTKLFNLHYTTGLLRSNFGDRERAAIKKRFEGESAEANKAAENAKQTAKKYHDQEGWEDVESDANSYAYKIMAWQDEFSRMYKSTEPKVIS